MNGQMMHMSLLVSSLLVHAERHHPEQEIVSRRVEGDIHRETFAQMAIRTRKLANALSELGIKKSERVATLAWNGYRHMEIYYASSGSGAVLHTLNPRLHPDQAVYIADHAEDQVLFFDLSFLPLIESIAARTKTIKAYIAMTDRSHMPAESTIANLLCYEELIENQSDEFLWPELDEQSACTLCYTSGTTGNPKGVLYSHRSTLLHTYAAALPDALNCSALDVILPVVPMFHVNSWGLPYIACMTGSKLVFPGPGMDGKSLYELMETEQVTLSAGVPTVWQGLLSYMEENDFKFSSMKRTVIGGSSCPPSMLANFENKYGVHVLHAWGMTEMSPLGTVMALKPQHLKLSSEEQLAMKAKQGRVIFGVDMKVVDETGTELSRDGSISGDLMVRGHWVISRYFKHENENLLAEGWFSTGDVANIDDAGLMQITDRSKDVIKSGGEWISSIEIENIALSHSDVAMAACISVPHLKWDERPLLIIVKKPGAMLTAKAMPDFFEGKIAKWWIPDAVLFVDSIPIGATGKVQKNKLREKYKDISL